MLVAFRFLHLFSVVVWVGMIVFFTFFAAPSIFKVLSKETAGDVIGHIFPKYWLVGYVTSVVALLTVIGLSVSLKAFPTLRIAVIVIMTALTFYSGLVVGKDARAIKASVRAAEEGEQKERLAKSFRKVHAKSAILNLLVLLLGIFYVFLLSREMGAVVS